MRLDLRLARLEQLPRNPQTLVVDHTLYEVLAPKELADRILCRADQPFWLLQYDNSRARPLHEPAQRLLQVFNQPDNNSVVVREENGNEHPCNLNSGRSALIRFLVESIGHPQRLYFSLLQPPPPRSSHRRERSEAPHPQTRLARPRLEDHSGSSTSSARFERPAASFRESPRLTPAQRQLLRQAPQPNRQRQANPPSLSPEHINDLLDIDPQAFCHNFEDFDAGMRALITAYQSRAPQGLRKRCATALRASAQQAQAAVRHWSDPDVDSMGRLCRECRSDFPSYQTLLGVLANMLVQHRPRLDPAMLTIVANLLSHYKRSGRADTDAVIEQAVGQLAQEFQLVRQRLTDSKSLSLLANCFGKWPAVDACAAALSALAHDYNQGGYRLDSTKPQHLANLANAWSKCVDQPDCAKALDTLARGVNQNPYRLDSAEPQHLANLANAWSKCVDQPDCVQALGALARGVNRSPYRLDSATPQELANLANAWSKCVDQPDCATALGTLAHGVNRSPSRLNSADPQALANLANAWSKCVDQPDCAQALDTLAGIFNQAPSRLDSAEPQHLVNLANAWSKCVDQPGCAQALNTLAGIFNQAPSRLDSATPQDLAILANAWSKCVDTPGCAKALDTLAHKYNQGHYRLDSAESQHLANLANAWSKCVDQPDCATALDTLAHKYNQGHYRLDSAEPQHLANLANAWSKCVDQPDCATALDTLGSIFNQAPSRLDSATPQELASLANAWSKCVNQPDCVQALATLAHGVNRSPSRLNAADPQVLANLANAWSKCAEQPDCVQALATLARCVNQGRYRLDSAGPQALANLANAWSKCAEQNPDCRSAINRVVAHGLGGDGPAFGDFDIISLSLLANALSRNGLVATTADENDIAMQAHDQLTDLMLRLEEAPMMFATAHPQGLAMLLRAMGRAGLRDERRRLAPVMLQRLEQLQNETLPFESTTLETFGHLSIGLRPLAMQSQRKQRALRGQVLQTLDRLQPFVAKALAQQSASTSDTRQSLLPAVSTRYIFEAYAVVAHTLRPRNLPRSEDGRHTAKVLADRRQALSQWLTAEEVRLRPLFEGSIDVSLWDLQARLRAPGTGLGGALDRLLQERAGEWSARQPPSVFDVRQALAVMDHPPRTPQGDAGLYQPPYIDVRGRLLEQRAVPRYHVLTHLTGGMLPFAVVELGSAPSLAVLERPIKFNDEVWRSDIVGGSRMKKGQLRARQTMGAESERPGGPKLLALRLSETLPGSAYDDLARSLMPAREDFFRFQRMFLSSPPNGIKGLKPQDHVLQGTFPIGILPDREGQHTFRFYDAQGRPIALQPHDGCGFVRQSLLERLPAYQKAWGHRDDGKAEPPLPPYATAEPGNLPGQALQHYPRSEPVAKEVREQLAKAASEKPVEHDRLFRAVTTGLIQGQTAIVVPSADDRVHLSSAKAADFLCHRGGVLIGRSPYDKPNLRPLAADQVVTAEQDDPTASFLDSCTTLQYSYVGDQVRSDSDSDDPVLFAAKGLMVGIPDALWPQAFSNTDIVMSAQDIKTQSNWKSGKQRVTEDTLTSSRGLLVANEIFMPGSLIAMPRVEQQRLDGDFDGDTALIVAGRPALFEHVRQFDTQRPRPPVLKPPKTHSTPFDAEDDHYQHGRSSEILPVYAGVMEQFSTLQTRYMAQPEAVREAIATRMLYGSFEGLPKGWKTQIRAALDGDTVDTQRIDKLRQVLLEQQREAPALRAAARALETELLHQLTALMGSPSAVQASSSFMPSNADEIPAAAALSEEYQVASTPAERIGVLLTYYPERQLSSRVGYERPSDAQQCLQNLLSLGIKAGTDAYKSQTGVYQFTVLGRHLDRLLRTQGTVAEAPYTKGTARRLADKRFDADKAQRELEDNPTLAASVMSASLQVPALQRALKDQRPDPTPSASDRQKVKRLATELNARAHAHHHTVSGKLEAALKRVGAGTLFERDKECKGRDSIRDKILRKQQGHTSDPHLGAKNINDALRFHVELDDHQFTGQYQAIMDTLDKGGIQRLRTRNCFTLGENARYKGVNVTRTLIIEGETVPFEMQFHTSQSRAMKHQTHHIYKDAQHRELRGGQAERIEQLKKTMCQRWRDVPAPPGVEGIGNSGGEWPEAGLWTTLTAKAMPDEPFDEEDEEVDDDE